MNFHLKYINHNITIEDQKEALTSSYWAFLFAKENIPGSDFKALQAKACESPGYARWFVEDIPWADKKYCFKHIFPENICGPNKWKSEYNKYIMKLACE